MSNNFVVVALSDTPGLAKRLKESVPNVPIYVESTPEGEAFCFARNANRAIRAFPNDSIILVNDDVVQTEPDTFGRMADIATAHSTYGIVGTMVRGGVGNPFQDAALKNRLWHPEWRKLDLNGHAKDVPAVCFVCVYLKRRMIDEIGLLDESFTGYGFDDVDYCIRARRAGWKTIIAGEIEVQHGDGSPTENGRGRSWSLSYARANVPDNTDIFNAKYA